MPNPGLLLMHGAGDDGSCWAPFATRLRRAPGMAELVVATPDAPAHGGRVAGPGQTIAWPDLLADAVAHAEQLVARTGGPIVSAGHSMGSMTALGVAATRPDLVAATFLEDPPLMHPLPPVDAPREPSGPADLSEFQSWFTELQATPLDELISAVRAEHPTWDEAEYEPWARSKHAVDAGAFSRPVVFAHSDTDRLIRAAPSPVVVVAGRPELGGMLAPAAEADLVDLPGWTVHRLPTGHDVRRDAPDRTVALLAELIRSVRQ